MSSLLLITFIVLDKPISSTKDKRATGMAGVALTNFTRREVENSIQVSLLELLNNLMYTCRTFSET